MGAGDEGAAVLATLKGIAQTVGQLVAAIQSSFPISGTIAGTGRLLPTVFASLPAASAANEGSIACVTDSTTVTWGATITGGGTHVVLAFSDGTHWTVAGI
jgi:hypothetical protein